jgi:hypothetical protein
MWNESIGAQPEATQPTEVIELKQLEDFANQRVEELTPFIENNTVNQEEVREFRGLMGFLQGLRDHDEDKTQQEKGDLS